MIHVKRTDLAGFGDVRTPELGVLGLCFYLQVSKWCVERCRGCVEDTLITSITPPNPRFMGILIEPFSIDIVVQEYDGGMVLSHLSPPIIVGRSVECEVP